MVGIAAFASLVKLKGTQKIMAEAAVGTKSLGAMFAAALAALDKIIVATNNPSDIIPSHKLKEP